MNPTSLAPSVSGGEFTQPLTDNFGRQSTPKMVKLQNLKDISDDYLGVDDEDVSLVDAVVLVQDVEEDVEQRAAAGVGGGF